MFPYAHPCCKYWLLFTKLLVKHNAQISNNIEGKGLITTLKGSERDKQTYKHTDRANPSKVGL